MKRSFLILSIVCVFAVSHAFSQLSVTSYSIHAVGVNTSTTKQMTGELKVFANRDYDDLVMELSLSYNFASSDYHRFSAGFGINAVPFAEAEPLNAFTFPVQLEVFPIQVFKRLSLVFEVAPEWVFEDPMRLRTLWGLRYSFGQKE
ncbi:MAG: hypothetical protein R6U66_01705 [Bacteroidales bacterium]